MAEYWDYLREIREDRNLKQADVAEYLGISQQAYSRYETGKFPLPIYHLLALCQLYHVTPNEILGYPSEK